MKTKKEIEAELERTRSVLQSPHGTYTQRDITLAGVMATVLKWVLSDGGKSPCDRFVEKPGVK